MASTSPSQGTDSGKLGSKRHFGVNMPLCREATSMGMPNDSVSELPRQAGRKFEGLLLEINAKTMASISPPQGRPGWVGSKCHFRINMSPCRGPNSILLSYRANPLVPSSYRLVILPTHSRNSTPTRRFRYPSLRAQTQVD
jgi:hypothetical protein